MLASVWVTSIYNSSAENVLTILSKSIAITCSNMAVLLVSCKKHDKYHSHKTADHTYLCDIPSCIDRSWEQGIQVLRSSEDVLGDQIRRWILSEMRDIYDGGSPRSSRKQHTKMLL